MKILHRVVSFSRVIHWILTSIAVLLVLLVITGMIVIRTQRFRDYVRRRIVEQVETATNAKFEYGRFVFNWEKLTAEMTQVKLHGKETDGEPLVSADSVTLGMRIISLAERKIDLAQVRLVRPRARIIFYEDGSTNIPSPTRKTTWAEDVLDLAVKDYEAIDGVVDYNETRIPLRAQGQGLHIRMSHDAAKEVYSGDFTIDRTQVGILDYAPVPASIQANFTLERARLAFPRIRITTKGGSRVDVSGGLDDMRQPHGLFAVRAQATGAEVVREFKIPADPAGSGVFDGKLTIALAPKFDFNLTGKASAKGVGFSRGNLRVANAEAQGDVNLNLDRMTVRNLNAQALGSRIAGQADVSDWRSLHFEGSVDGVGLHDAAYAFGSQELPWTGVISGPVRLDANFPRGAGAGSKAQFALRADASISPGVAGVPVQGELHATWDSAAGSLALAPSWVSTAATRVDASGTLVAGALSQTIAVKLHSTNLDDLLPGLALASADAPKKLPIQLNNGTVDADGTIAGTIENPAFSGHVSATNASVEGHAFTSFSADVRASKDQVQAAKMTLVRGSTSIAGSASAQARAGSFEDASVEANVEFRNAAISDLIHEFAAQANVPGQVSGTASGSVKLAGTLHNPDATVTADIQQPAGFGESADRLRTTFHYTPSRVDVGSGQATVQNTAVDFSGSYARSGANWNNGRAEFTVASQSLPTARIRRIAEMQQPPVEATLAGKVQGSANIANGEPAITALNGSVSAQGLSLYKQAVGSVSATFQTRNADLSVSLNGKLRDATFEGSGAWRLDSDQPGSATLRFSRITLATLNSLAMIGGTPAQQQSSLPFDGFVEGSTVISVPLKKPGQYSAEVTLAAIQLSPKPQEKAPIPAAKTGTQSAAKAAVQDIVLRNSGPVSLRVDSNGVRIAPAQFTARDTALSVSGTVPFGNGGADVSMRGNVNLAILQLFNSDLLAKGTANLDATVRGAWRDPTLNGRMQFANASLYLADVPNGVDNVNGTILFDRNRATIDRLTAETGGGRISFTGGLDFGRMLVYRLAADAQGVRVRYPEDVSTTFNAKLELNGTPDASTISGTVTLNRTTLNPRTDLGRLMSQWAKPTPTPSTPNEYLRGMQLDIKVESAPDFELDTALTREVETGIDLRVRGTPLQPVALGTISINSGELQLFGNKYVVDRGDIRFLNPVKLDPVLDISLETKARGIVVNVSLSGTLEKFKMNYSSDPPLQPSEIVALLAVGRDPSQTAGVTNPSAASTTGFVEAGGSLLGEAVSQQLSSRLQRFFGASRVKIDPTMTGVDNSPQARLTLEQQISKDITMTYITNLNYTQEQTVRLQWDFDRNWSAVAVRDANGLFGIDIQYRRRF